MPKELPPGPENKDIVIRPQSRMPAVSELRSKVNREKELVGDRDVEILFDKLERTGLDRFDGELISLLERVIKENNYRTVVGELAKFFYPYIETIAPKVAGWFSFWEGAQWGKEFITTYVTENLKQQGKDALSTILFEETGFLASIKRMINEAVDKVASTLINTMAGGAGGMAGIAAYIPSGIAGYLGGSFITGGSLGVFREMKRSSGFEIIGGYIEKSERMIESDIPNEDGTDPRQDLIVLHKRILNDPKRMGHKLKNEDWLKFAAAVRRARVDILRDKTKAPDIIADAEARQSLEAQSRVTDQIIEIQSEIAEVDMEMAAEILNQYQTQLARELRPAEKRIINYNDAIHRAQRYVNAFVREGMNGTGLPFLLRVVRSAGRTVIGASVPGSRVIFKR